MDREERCIFFILFQMGSILSLSWRKSSVLVGPLVNSGPFLGIESALPDIFYGLQFSVYQEVVALCSPILVYKWETPQSLTYDLAPLLHFISKTLKIQRIEMIYSYDLFKL